MVVQLLALDPSIIISLNGALCGFFLIYVIPIGIHLKCLYGDAKKRTCLKEATDGSTYLENNFGNGNINLLSIKETILEYDECVDHKQLLKDNKYLICVFYFFLGFIGFSIMVAQIEQIIFG